MEDFEKFKEKIRTYLEKDNYTAFIDTIGKEKINSQNYILYLEAIKEVMKEKFEKQNPFAVTSADRLKGVFGIREKRKTYLEILPDLNDAIVEVFKDKLGVGTTNYEDDDISKRLDNFKERFM